MSKRLAFFTFALCMATGALAAEPAVYTGLLSNTGAGGYDTVSYFAAGRATKGSSDYTSVFQGATWRFANAENLALFEANPERFAPVYGGYCAWAVAQGYLAKGDPQHWTIRNDRLYLNYSQSIQDRWLKNPDGFIQQANANWPGVLE
ncbi:hypothetical protein MARI_01660 [Marinobacter sp. JH2]|nr:YHS domain-containing (seleno)protein [Marinobacter sp. JH2]QBM16086.1 hypothetical protein MARI_01660 [Marinobacter sp. JH2]